MHAIPANQPKGWTFNDNLDKPTFSPSILINGDPKFVNPTAPRCHLFVRDGQLQYCGDCSHELSGKTVEMEDVNKGFLARYRTIRS
jgi:hypothetical protein